MPAMPGTRMTHLPFRGSLTVLPGAATDSQATFQVQVQEACPADRGSIMAEDYPAP